jgi:hypothetical protein
MQAETRGRTIFVCANENRSVQRRTKPDFLRGLYAREISTNRWCCLDEALLRSYFGYSGVCTQAASVVCTAGITGMLSYDRIIREVLSLSPCGKMTNALSDTFSGQWFATVRAGDAWVRKTLNKFTSVRDSAHGEYLSAPRKSHVCQELR